MTTRICLAVAFLAVVVGIGAMFMPVDRCGMAWKAALDPERAVVYDSLEGLGPGEGPWAWASVDDSGVIHRSLAFCEQEGRTRLLGAGVGGTVVAVAALGTALLVRRPGPAPR